MPCRAAKAYKQDVESLPTTWEILLTLAFIVDAALGFRLKLSPDVIKELIEALAGASLGASHDAGRRVAVVHGRDATGMCSSWADDCRVPWGLVRMRCHVAGSGWQYATLY